MPAGPCGITVDRGTIPSVAQAAGDEEEEEDEEEDESYSL